MHLARIHIKNFRNYREATIDLQPGVSVFVADNGSGKTNILEAIFYLSQLSSHRLGGSEVLIKQGEQVAQVIAKAVEGDRTELYEVQVPTSGRRVLTINRNPIGQPRRFKNKVRSVLFAPEDLNLVREDAAARRDAIDQLTAAISPSEAMARESFDKALKQRNALLKALQKSNQSDSHGLRESLTDWNTKYVKCSIELITARNMTLAAIAPRVKEIYRNLTSEQDDLRVRYSTKSISYSDLKDSNKMEDELLQALKSNHSVELARGVTMIGPHRDDLEIDINGLLARTHASQGEAWSIALTWRVASFDILTEIHQSPPILLLDDVFTQLDVKRRELLISRFAKADQVLVTTAVESDVPEALVSQRFEIKGGEVIAFT